MVSEEDQGVLTFGHADNMAWYIVGLIYDSFLNILIYEVWDGMTSLETKGRDIYKVLLWNVLERLKKTKNLSHGDEQIGSMWFQDPQIQSGYCNCSIANSVSFMNCSSGWETNTNNTLM
jgi:hypothetical protein